MDRVQLLGHRGLTGAADAAENTVTAVRAAYLQGADGVEIDVRLTADGVPVCVHDPDLRALAGIPEQVGSLTWQRLGHIRPTAGGTLPRLEHILSAAKQHGGLLVLDLKENRDDAAALTQTVLDALRADPVPGVVLSSFSERVVEACARRSRLPTALITDREVPAAVALRRALALGCSAIHPHAAALLDDHEVGDRATRSGLAVRCWAVRRPVDATLLEVAGVDAVIVDDVAGMRRGLRRREAAAAGPRGTGRH